MNHLRLLAILDFVLGGLLLLAALGWALLYGAGTMLAPEPELQLLFAAAGVVIGALLALLGILALLAGALLLGSRSTGVRVLQTVVAVPHLFNMPLGTAFAVYSLWVCWAEAAASG